MERADILALSRSLSNAPRDELLSETHRSVLEEFRASAVFGSLNNLWSAHAQGKPIAPEDAHLVRQYSYATFVLYLKLAEPFRRVISLADDAPPQPDAMIDVTKARGFLRSLLDTDKGHVFATAKNSVFPSDVSERTVLDVERFCAYQHRLVADRELFIQDPIDFTPRKVRDCFVYNGRGIYMFGGPNPYYLITAGGGQKLLALYIPKLSLIVDFNAGMKSFLDHTPLVNSFAHQIQRLANHRDAHAAAMELAEADIAKNDLTICMGHVDNFAHHLWNHFPTLDRLVRAGLGDRVDHIQTFATEFFGPLTDLYPEFAGRHVHVDKKGLIDNKPFDPGYLVMIPGAYFISEDLKTRLLTVAATRTQWTPPARDVPVIWFGIRVGSRSWIGQEHAIPDIIRAIHGTYPQAIFILDGFTYPVGRDFISMKWADTIAGIRHLVADIETRLPKGAHCVNLVGKSMFDAILWADRADTYVAPIGTTQHKVGWFTKGQGLIYCGPEIENVPELRRPGCWEAEGIRPAQYVIGEAVSDGDRRVINDNRKNLENIRLDTDNIIRQMLDILARQQNATAG